MSTPTYVVTKRHAVSVCAGCWGIGEEWVRPYGDPDEIFWFGLCRRCRTLRWHELLGFLEWFAIEETPGDEEDTDG